MSKNILHIDSSIFGDKGHSSQLSAQIVDALKSSQEIGEIKHRVLDGQQLPHFNAGTIAAIGEGQATLADSLIDELQSADIIVLGVPMYNFGVPSELKAWFDHVARAGVTFKYTETGPVGLLNDKKVYVVTTRGGVHRDQATDVETPFLKIMLGFLGLTDVQFIYAEGLNLSGDSKDQALRKANAEIEAIASQQEEVAV